MIPVIKSVCEDFIHLFFPHNCEGCGTDLLAGNSSLCTKCLLQLPATGFFSIHDNPVEKIFHGRLNIAQAGAAYYFSKHSLLQHLLVQLKYRQNREAGYFLGRITGRILQASARFSETDLLVPLPLNPEKEHTRGYNQAALICEGIAETWKKPVLPHAVTRIRFTETQTRQNRISRWQNMKNVFEVTEPAQLRNKHILLVDDVITTGATLEACGERLLRVEGLSLSLAAVAYTM